MNPIKNSTINKKNQPTYQNETSELEPYLELEKTIQQTNKGNEEIKTKEKEKEQMTNEENIMELEP